MNSPVGTTETRANGFNRPGGTIRSAAKCPRTDVLGLEFLHLCKAAEGLNNPIQANRKLEWATYLT
jgi:hypothetical protein